MTELLAQVLTAFGIGLLGSGHCLAMCGGIMGALSLRAATAVGPAVTVTGPMTMLGPLLRYSIGRLTSYALLGLVVGLAGALLVAVMEPARVVLRGFAGGILIAMGLYLAGLWHGMLAFERLGHGIWQRLGNPRRGGAYVLGMSWGLLPCGLVYGTLAWSAANADPLRGSLLMFAFGLGTLPAVLAGSVFSAHLLAPLRRRGLRLAVGLLVVTFGIWTLLGGGLWPGSSHTRHDHGTAGAVTGSAAESIIRPEENTGCS